jgi:hypothetical protein
LALATCFSYRQMAKIGHRSLDRVSEPDSTPAPPGPGEDRVTQPALASLARRQGGLHAGGAPCDGLAVALAEVAGSAASTERPRPSRRPRVRSVETRLPSTST